MENKYLVVGSLATASDKSYQALVQELEAGQSRDLVERHLWDRIVAGAAGLSPANYKTADILLSKSDIDAFSLSDLLGPISEALINGGDLRIQGCGTSIEQAVLVAAGFEGITRADETITAKKSATTAGSKRPLDSTPSSAADASANGASVPLKLRRGPATQAAKASLWAFSSAAPAGAGNEGLIDDDALLTEEDRLRPTLVTRPDCDVKRSRKACKNCTCGLRELELEQEDDLPGGKEKKETRLNEAIADADAKEAVQGGRGLKKRFVKTGAVTSSCGSCYLGDAFRCSGCPYLGLPAFEPGQKVELTAEMGDDI